MREPNRWQEAENCHSWLCWASCLVCAECKLTGRRNSWQLQKTPSHPSALPTGKQSMPFGLQPKWYLQCHPVSCFLGHDSTSLSSNTIKSFLNVRAVLGTEDMVEICTSLCRAYHLVNNYKKGKNAVSSCVEREHRLCRNLETGTRLHKLCSKAKEFIPSNLHKPLFKCHSTLCPPNSFLSSNSVSYPWPQHGKNISHSH